MYTANLLNQYEQRDVPGRVRLMGAALPEAIITINNEQTTRQQGGYFHWSQAVSNTNSAAYPGVSILAVLQGAGTNGADIVATETGRVFVAESPELFTYDLDGNLLTDGRWTNTWDGENRLIRVETRSDLPGEIPRVRADFTYDGQGRRIAEDRFAHDGTNWVSVSSTRFLYDGWLLLAEVDNSGAFARTYTWGLDLSGSMQGAGGVGGLLAMHQGGNTHAYAYDGNGNVIALISADGTTAANYEYGPFGEPLRATDPAADANRFRFSTKWEDQDTGWLYYGYRWMDPGKGRWLNRDPIGEDGGDNLYGFVLNQAISLWDRLGKQPGESESIFAGPDITTAFLKTLNHVSTVFNSASMETKFSACCKLATGRGVGAGWDIYPLYYLGAGVYNATYFGDSASQGRGSLYAERSVVLNLGAARPYLAAAANYALFGRMFRLCQHQFNDPMFSLATAYTMVVGQAGVNIFLGNEPHLRDKLAFTKTGYDGTPPTSAALSGISTVTGNRALSRRFPWKWVGVHQD